MDLAVETFINQDVKLDELVLSFCPLTDFYTRAAVQLGFPSPEFAAKYLLFYPERINVIDKGRNYYVDYIPSTQFTTGLHGPRQHYDTFVIGKCPSPTDIEKKANFVGSAGSLLRGSCERLEIKTDSWYMSNVVRWIRRDKKELLGQHIRDCLPLLFQEIALVKPRFLLLCGADAVKAICGKQATLQKLQSEVFVYDSIQEMGKIPHLLKDVDNSPSTSIQMLCTIHPDAVRREESLRPSFERDLELFNSLSIEYKPTDLNSRDYRYVFNAVDLKAVVDEILNNNNFREISIDCEWGNGNFLRGILRTVQFSWKAGNACVVVFAHEGGIEAQPVDERIKMVNELRRLISSSGMGIIGHNLRADAKWLEALGLPVVEHMVFDTMSADHALFENAKHGLEDCSCRYTNMGRYDYPLMKWLSKHNINIKKRGYIDIPDELLLLYGACDADCTFRVAQAEIDLLSRPENVGVLCCFMESTIPVNKTINEIECTGLLADRERMVKLVRLYDAKKNELLDKLRVVTGNKYFNPRSYIQIADYLFNTKETGGLGLTPFKVTGKPAKMWEDIVRNTTKEELNNLSPSTDTETLEYLASEHPSVGLLHEFKVIDQVAKSFLRLPEDGNDSYESGLVGSIDPDERIHTSISQMSETGRWKSSQPNLANLPKKQESELKRIMGEHVPSVRSCFTVAPGCVLIESDYVSAEVYTLGYLSNCPKLIKAAGSDLHSRGVVDYFGKPKWDGYDEWKKPPPEWLKEYKAIRVGSKTITFGVFYLRGAKALSRQIIRETKGELTPNKYQTQEFIDRFFDTYPEVTDYINMCKYKVNNPPYYIENPVGRRRRFSVKGADQGAIAAQERECVNFPIQSSVAYLLDQSMINIFNYRHQYPNKVKYKILMGIYDAVLLEVPGEYAKIVVDEVLPDCMTRRAVVPSWIPTSDWTPTQPFSLDTDRVVSVRWGVDPSCDELKAANVCDELIERFAE